MKRLILLLLITLVGTRGNISKTADYEILSIGELCAEGVITVVLVDKGIDYDEVLGSFDYTYNKAYIDGKCYIKVSVFASGDIASIMKAKHKIEKVLNVIDANLIVKYKVDGELNTYEKELITNVMLNSLNARTTFDNSKCGVYNIYGYTFAIDDYCRVLGKRVNVNITITYDEANDSSYIYMATPVNNSDF